jgi:hypothetical protein
VLEAATRREAVMSMSSFATIFLAALAIYFVLRLLRRRRKAKVVRKGRTEIDRWIDDALSRELQRRLGLAREVVLNALEGTPEPEVVGAMEDAVRGMQVRYVWNPDGSVDVRLDISFEDGTNASVSRLFPRDSMPTEIRDEFKRTGASSVLRAVYFPWSTPE